MTKNETSALVAFAEDVFRRPVWDGGDGGVGVCQVLDESDLLLDEALKRRLGKK